MRDEILIHELLSGNRRALSIFYRNFAPKLSSYIQTKIGNPRDAEEVLQDTLFAFLDAVRDFTGKSNLSTFIFSICNHKITDYYRRKKITHLVFSRAPQLEYLISPLITPEEQLDTVLLKEKIHAALTKLLPNHKSVLVLKYIDNISVHDIAQKLATTLKGAESQLFRARKAFIEAFLSI